MNPLSYARNVYCLIVAGYTILLARVFGRDNVRVAASTIVATLAGRTSAPHPMPRKLSFMQTGS
jgi:hypothetical protein